MTLTLCAVLPEGTDNTPFPLEVMEKSLRLFILRRGVTRVLEGLPAVQPVRVKELEPWPNNWGVVKDP
jgi:hypothetical protein